MDIEKTRVSHIGGSKGSLDDSVKKLDELQKAGLTEVNGIDIDKYKEIIRAGGGGEDPTDTLVVMVEYDENGKPTKANFTTAAINFVLMLDILMEPKKQLQVLFFREVLFPTKNISFLETHFLLEVLVLLNFITQVKL